MAKLKSYKFTTNALRPPPPPPPPWEVVGLVAPYLEPKIVAVASCVSKSWYVSMSSDHIWEQFCTAHYPSLSQLRLANPLLRYCRLYAMAYTATKLRVKSLSKPQLSLDKLMFVINISTKEKNHSIINKAVAASALDQHKHKGVFRFDIDVDDSVRETKDVKVSWVVVVEGWRAVFTMIDMEGEVGFSHGGGEGWLSEELPLPGCCFREILSSGMVADLKLGYFRSQRGGEVKVEKMTVGILSSVNWRYVSIENGLRYLQHFLVQ